MKQGQILILVLLVVVVILAVGLSVASRNITNLRTSTQTEQSQRAFTAAEGGVEDVLSNLEAIGTAITTQGDAPAGCSLVGSDTAECDISVGGTGAKVNIKSSSVYPAPIKLGNVAQIDLDGFVGDSVRVEWAIENDPIEVVANGSAAVEISLVYGPAPSYNIERWYFPGTISGAARGEILGPNPPGTSPCSPSGFMHCVEVDVSSLSPEVLRIRPFFTKTTPRVAGVGADLPLQVYDVSSTATTEIGVTRKVQVTRSALPQVPAVFDFALYSETDIIK
ncbi:hypothetical protein A3J17_04040 [Candidatus Curtissbacteria bacterium RIFCSPLOWO2_02_FULL_40_11]|nr:MAG: hypothetical protein A3J17_04040 [Candidatus Curtissbacteria bacterium RIFCSPLOWO2_02_FULL_40_11]